MEIELSLGARRTLLHMFECAFVVAAAVAVCLAWPSPAFAYVDPSVMTYTIQAVAGVVVALSAVLGVAFRRSRRAIMRVLGIDENARKLKDPPVVRVDPCTAEGQAELAQSKAVAEELAEDAAGPSRAKGAGARPLSFGSRFWRALLVSLFTVGTVFAFTPLGIVARSGASLLYQTGDVALPVLLCSLALAALVALLASLARGKAFRIVLAALFALGVCCYVQTLFLNYNLPIADGTRLDMSDYQEDVAIGWAVWLPVLAVIVGLAVWKPRPVAAVSVVLACVLVAVEGVTLIASAADARANMSEYYSRNVVTREGINTVSAEENVIVFVLDTFDVKYMDRIYRDYPDVFDGFTGFTLYRDSTSAMSPTRYGLTVLMTGRMPEGGEDFDEFTGSWYWNSHLVPDIAEQGYSIGLYSDSLNWGGKDFLAPYASNIHSMDEMRYDVAGTLMMAARTGLYGCLPWGLKPSFWYSTDDMNSAFVGAEKGSDLDGLQYTVDDELYGWDLRNGGLAFNDEGKSFKMIHMLGLHRPWTLGANGMVAGCETNYKIQGRGVFSILEDYLDEMRRLGVYDDAAIIVTTDHGSWGMAQDGDELGFTSTALFMVKPPQSAEEAAEPMKYSDAPTGTIDLAPTIAALVGAPYDDYMGENVLEVAEGAERDRYYWATVSLPDGHHEFSWQQYLIQGDALDYDNSWTKTGVEIVFPDGYDFNDHM